MTHTGATCVYCREAKTEFTKEHIVPVCFGGTSKYLKQLVCADCNRAFNECFEGKFLKGPGFESLIRGVKGLQGRHGIPIFGDGSYGNRLFAKVREHFPPIQISLSKTGLRAAIQLISVSEDGRYFHAVFDRDQYEGNFRGLIDGLWKMNPDSSSTRNVFLWIRDTDINVAIYRLARKEFYKYLGVLGLDGDFLCDSIEGFPIELTWETVERQRMYCKMCLNSLFMLFPFQEFALNMEFDQIRQFILTGLPEQNSFVMQWTASSNPIVEMLGLDYNLSIGLFEFNTKLFGTVYFPSIGLFIVRVGAKPTLPFDRIIPGLQPMENDLCFFYSVISEKEGFLVSDRKIAVEIRKRLTQDPLFQLASA